ncbi:MAG: hypothetical protein HOQ43_01695 [Glycomyces artemisiae]|uniref:Uncharacterized protein n=1 Tax=Glycomyces artemisiae TaxID=1076443 RepID=A0A850C212_9ACTN|nr:hypothetical protein [Glycomyces artemisiae]
MWKDFQKLRLAQEAAAVERLMPYFGYDYGADYMWFSGWWRSNLDRPYFVRTELPPTYPDAVPDTYVVRPSPLLDSRGRHMTSYGSNHDMHTWATDREGQVKICIVRPEDWSAEYSVVKVLRKALLWITAYESHTKSGRPIADYLL